ncbi:DegT/DnrJ/EryC1/StrS family aminotransferase [Bradyrhizobium sp. G127]|uniref:DegT/DnrJ/EryC1/StrS family aminotransferase n=1 Tax=Bradyrhizobium sp. G127 TaxID=2904800 RepID=UPI001F3E491E|nr:DegT/DnrJ/EryC1/StrS family aminotransferase [Bradyrhizobium sp. G127]
MVHLENRLATLIGRKHCIAVGRGATALWLAFRAIRDAQRNVLVLPATLCLSPAFVAQLAGFQLEFCDVEPSTGNLSPEKLERLLASNSSVRAVLLAHLYGQPAKIKKIKAICSAFDVLLIEDVAQALGASTEGRMLGAFGDVTILSFGHTKILDAGGGGALLLDDDALADELRSASRDLPNRHPESSIWAEDYRKAYYALAPLTEQQPRLRSLIGALGAAFPKMYVYRFEHTLVDPIDHQLDQIDREIDHRRAMASGYAERLRGLPLSFMETDSESVPWRFNIKLEEKWRNAALTALRNENFDASSWYPALPPFFRFDGEWEAQYPGASDIEAGIVNLWVDRSVTRSRVMSCCESLARSFDRIGEKA